MTNPQLEARKARLQQTAKILQKLAPCDYNKALTVVCMNLGVREQLAREYIRLAAEWLELEIKGGRIERPKASDRDKP